MGAGKSTLGPELAARLGRPFVSVDAVVEERAGGTVEQIFATRGEADFRELEGRAAVDALGSRTPAVIELGGGALGSAATRHALAEAAFTLLVEVTPDEAWERVSGTGRPLARDEAELRALYEERRWLYEQVADGRAADADGAVLAAAGVHVEAGALDRLGALVPGDGPVDLVADTHVAYVHGGRAQDALGDRLSAVHEVPRGEPAKSVVHAERLWSALRLEREGTLVALGGGSVVDVAGFVAATYLRGVAWAPVPTTLVGQVDAGVGGKTAVDLAEGKNLVGAFHWPARVVADPDVLETLAAEERANGRAEVVKSGLLTGEPLWELPAFEQVRRCAAFKAAVCLRDPRERGVRAQLNLGHTFAHALETASGYALPHGRALGLGLLAALRLSGLDEQVRTVEAVLRPEPIHVDREVAWEALLRDKKSKDGKPRLVLLDAPGSARIGVELEPEAVRAALDALIE